MAVSARHVRRGTIRVWWVTTIADTSAPTVAEITAGTDLTGDIATFSGFALERSVDAVVTPDGYGAVLSLPRALEAPSAPSLTIYDEGTGNDALRSTLADATQGYVVFCLDGAPTLGERAVVWPVISLGAVDVLGAAAEAATMVVTFAVWDLPDEEATIA